MRNMSFIITTAQARAQLKWVTRRLGWNFLKPGDHIRQVVKGRGLKKGEEIEKLHVIAVRDVRFEPLDLMLSDPEYGRLEVVREGFPHLSPPEFVKMLCEANHCWPDQKVNRIYFSYVSPATKCPMCQVARWYIDAGGKVKCLECGAEINQK